MDQGVYQQLLTVMKKRGGGYSGMDIPEFYAMAEELFTPEKAEVNNAMPRGPFAAKDLAREMGREEAELVMVLESMADKGLCVAVKMNGVQFYQSARFMPGILEFQFMPGKTTERPAVRRRRSPWLTGWASPKPRKMERPWGRPSRRARAWGFNQESKTVNN
jgi:hypothetical protein